MTYDIFQRPRFPPPNRLQDAANLVGADKDFGSARLWEDDILKDGAANGEKEEIHEMPEVVKMQLLVCQFLSWMFLGIAQQLGRTSIIFNPSRWIVLAHILYSKSWTTLEVLSVAQRIWEKSGFHGPGP